MSIETTRTQNGPLIERLFKAGAHFGFSKSRRHPSVKQYIFAHKEGTDIFDLEQTSVLLANAADLMKQAGSEGKTVLFVSTKPEAATTVQQFAERAHMPYVVNRWIGGMLTNWSEIRKRIERMKALVTERDSGELERKYTKKERVVIGREIDKLEHNFGGIAAMDRLPHYLLVVDPRHDAIAIAEARDMKVPVIAVMSSDCDATVVTHPVIVNDSLQSSISLALEVLTAAYESGRASYVPAPVVRAPRPMVSREGARTERRPRPGARRA
jgi:small subunit ribosomal protein S2